LISTPPLLILRRACGDVSSERGREDSPPRDIALDNGAALLAEDEIEISTDDTHEDIAPALRAKRRA